jgi:CubicO group peptidase (beta-lactamase class C family)
MHSFKITACFIAMIFLAYPVSTKAQNKKYDDETEAQIKQVENNLAWLIQLKDSNNRMNLQERMAFYNVKGLSIAVVKDFKIAWARGYGWADEAAGKPVTPQTLFQAASISKSLNAVGVLKLVQDKKLDLYKDINDYLRTWKFPYDSISKGKKITTAHLLSHTGGLSVHGFPGYANGDTIPSLPQILDGKAPANTKAVRSTWEPGLRYSYSGGGITISQQLVMDITQQPYHEYMWEQVLKPLGMVMSTYQLPAPSSTQPFLATGYQADGKEIETKFHLYPEQAAAALWTNPTDLSRYIIETQQGLLGKPGKVLNSEMTKLRLTPYIDSNAALGVFIETRGGEKYFGHNGSNEGFQSNYTGSFRNGNGVVIMVNSDNGRIINEVLNSVATVYGWKGYFKPVLKTVMALPDSLLDAYAGNYLLREDSISIIRSGKQMLLRVNNREDFTIYFSGEKEFFMRDLPMEFRFERDASGKVSAFYMKQGGNEVRARKME